MKPDSDWNEDAEEELRIIEAAYSTNKRKTSTCSDLPAEPLSSSSQSRCLPSWANTTSIPRCKGKDHGSSCPCLTNGLCTFSPTPCQVNLKQIQQVFTFGGRIVYSRTSAEVNQATIEILDKIEQLKHKENEISLGVDIEWKPNFIKGKAPRKTAVLQICLDSSDCYVMHIFHSGIPHILKSLLEDPSSFKVGIGIDNDATKISRDYHLCIKSLIDLSRFANLKLGGAHKNWGLRSLTEMLTCKRLLKSSKIRLGNWEVKELSKGQLCYAATDAFASWFLYQILKTFPDPNPKTLNGEKSNSL